MPQFNWHQISQPADVASFLESLPPIYRSAEVMDLRNRLSGDLCGILLESHCADEDFEPIRSGTRISHQSVNRACLRMHLFGAGVTFDETNQVFTCPKTEAMRAYRGYITVRPSRTNGFGRTILDPGIVSNSMRRHPSVSDTHSVRLNLAVHTVTVAGIELRVKGFPWMNQVPRVAVCAHVCTWAILTHAAAQRSRKSELTLRALNRMIHGPDGLSGVADLGTSLQAIRSALNGMPIVLSSQTDDYALHDEVVSYIDSGIPVLAQLGGDRSHGVALIGYEAKETSAASGDYVGAGYSSLVSRLYVSDDHHFPYHSVSFDGVNNDNGIGSYAAQTVVALLAFVPTVDFVPFPEASQTLLQVWEQRNQKMPLRSSSRMSFRRVRAVPKEVMKAHLYRCKPEFGDRISRIILEEEWPEYFWVVEVSRPDAPMKVVAFLAISACASLKFELVISVREALAVIGNKSHEPDKGINNTKNADDDALPTLVFNM